MDRNSPKLMVSTASPSTLRAQRTAGIACSRKRKKKALFIMLMAATAATSYFHSMHTRRPKRNSILTSQKRIEELLQGHPEAFREQYGMNKHVFRALLQFLCQRCRLQNSRYISAAEQLSIFCHFATQGLSSRQLQDIFQHSADTISRFVIKLQQHTMNANVSL